MARSHLLLGLALFFCGGTAAAQIGVAFDDGSFAEPLATARLGTVLDLDGDTAIAATPGDLWAVEDAAFFYDRDPSGAWVRTATVLPPAPGSFSRFGNSAALCDDVAVIGEPGAIVIFGPPVVPGVAHVHVRSGSTWSSAATLTAPLPIAGDLFGESVAVAEGGSLIAVGSPGKNSGRGAVHIFRIDPTGTVWNHVAELVASDGHSNDAFGRAIEISGPYVFVGAPNDDSAVTDSGSVYVFEEQSTGAWLEVTKLSDPSATVFDQFGSAISGDGERVAITAPGNGQPGFLPGAVHVFDHTAATGAWTFSATVRAPNISGIGAFPVLTSVALDGDHLVLGHPAQRGTAHVFELNASGAWRVSVRLESEGMPPDGSFDPDYAFGHALAVSDERLLVSATGAGPFGVGGPNGTSGRVHEFLLGTLYHGVPRLHLPGPGGQALHLRATDAHAFDVYYLLGTASGTSPGFVPPLTSTVVPINFDAYSSFVVNTGGTLANTFGILDANGAASSAFVLPPGTDPALAGTQLDHCYVVIDVSTLTLAFASNPVRVSLE